MKSNEIKKAQKQRLDKILIKLYCDNYDIDNDYDIDVEF